MTQAMTSVLIGIIVKATALLAIAALLDAAIGRRASAATRHLLWSLTIAALLVLPFAVTALPAWQVRIPVQRAMFAKPAGAAPSSVMAVPDVAARATPAQSIATDEHGQTRPSSVFLRVLPWPFSAGVLLAAIYGFGVLLLLARLALEPVALRRLTRASAPLTDPSWRALLEQSTNEMRVRRPVRLLQSARDVMPLTFGTLAPAIVLPASAGEWTGDRRRAVLLHELAHVARYDCFVQRLTAVACAFYWPHPGVWAAARRLRVERELACDDRVLAAGAPARDYAGHLLDLAHSLRAAPAPATALGMARASQLERRLLAILDAARNRGALGGRGRLVFLAAAIGVILPIVAVRAALVPVEEAIEQNAPAAPATAQDLTGTWDMRPGRDPGAVQISVRTARGSHGRTLRIADVEKVTGNVPGAQAAFSGSRSGTVHFPLVREAGTFTVDGVGSNGVWAGTWTFAPNAAYAADLERRGIGRPTTLDQLDLAIADVGKEYLDALSAAGYAKPNVQLLVRAAQHGVDLGYLKEMTALGYKLGALDPLIRLRDHGVDPSYIRGMAASGISGLAADELVRTRDHGVDPQYIAGLKSLGYTGLPVDTLVTARDHGVDPEYIRGMQAAGFKQTLDELRRTRDHGVDPEYVKGLASLGYTGLSVDALVNARDHGVDPSYVRGMADVGFKSVPLDSLIRMRDHGVDPTYVRKLRDQGVSNLSVDDVIRRRDRGGE
jgi:beta-lactamase regulating signal transducer with metallopeptidase domain